ncbi:MAG: hypothetical protein JKP98_05065 [Rhodobacteraceae bacterium]|nr:hypothetical protein [Paracoccaceae bacterium]
MALEPAAEGFKAELAAVRTLGPQVEAGDPEPAGDDVLGPVACLEDAQRARRELLALVLRHREEVVLDLAQAVAAETRGADIGPGRSARWRADSAVSMAADTASAMGGRGASRRRDSPSHG